MREITDPALLEQLNGGMVQALPTDPPDYLDVVTGGATATPKRKEVLDPAILAQLDGIKPHQQPQEQGFFDRVGSDINKRMDEGNDAVRAYQSGQQGLFPTLLQTTGKVAAGSVNDIAGEAMVSGYRALPESAQNYISDKAGDAVNYVRQSPVGPVIKRIGAGYDKFAKDHPNEARSIESIGNITMAVPVLKGVTTLANKSGNVLRTTGNTVINSSKARAANIKADFVKELVSPHETIAVKTEQAGRAVEKGMLKQREVLPTPLEQKTIDAVAQLPISKNKSLLANHNIIAQENIKEAERLKAALSKNDVAFAPEEFQARMKSAVGNLEQNPLITGDATETANKILNKYNQILASNKSSASGLLESRKQLDRWIAQQKGAGVFDPARENAITSAVREIRQATNDFIAQKVPSAGVKASLEKQSSLYRAMENLQPKIAREPKNAATRLLKKGANIIPGNNPAVKTAAATVGLGALYASPAFAATGLGLYGAGKALVSPMTQRALGEALQKSGIMMGGKARGGLLAAPLAGSVNQMPGLLTSPR